MAVSFIGAKYGSASTSSTTITLAQAVLSGDLLVGMFALNYFGATGLSISDNINGAWTVGTSAIAPNTFDQGQMFYFPNSAAASANGLTVTVTATGGASAIRGNFACYRGAKTNPTVANAGTYGTNTTPSSGATSGGPAGSLIVGGLATTGNMGTQTAGSGYTLRSTGDTQTLLEDNFSGALGAVTANFTIGTSAVWMCGVLQFSPVTTQAFTQALAGGVSFTGSRIRRIGTALQATALNYSASPFQSSVVRNVQLGLAVLNTYAAMTTRAIRFRAVTPALLVIAGAQARAASIFKGASLGSSGSVLRAMVTRLYAASLLLSSTFSRRLMRLFTAALVSAGQRTLLINRFMAAGLISLGNLLRLSSRLTGFLGQLPLSGTLPRLSAKMTSAIVALVGSGRRTPSKVFSAIIAMTGAQTRYLSRAYAATLSLTGSRSQAVTRGLTASLTPTAAQLRRLARQLQGVLAYSGSLPGRAMTRSLTALVSSSGVIQRAVGRAWTATLAEGALLGRAMTKGMGAGLTSSGASVRAMTRALAGVVASRAAQVRALQRFFVASMSSAGSQGRFSTHALAASVTSAGAISRAMTRQFSARVSSTAGILRSMTRSLTAGLPSSGASSRFISRSLAAVSNFASSFTYVHNFQRAFTAAVAFTAGIPARVMGKLNPATLRAAGTMPRYMTRALATVLQLLGFGGRTLARKPLPTQVEIVIGTTNVNLSLGSADNRGILGTSLFGLWDK